MKIIVTGRDGQVARSLAALSSETIEFVTLGRPELDVTKPETLRRAIAELAPAALVNAGAYTAVDKAESDQEAAFAVNRDGAGNVAAATAEAGIPIVHISTDYVFSGTKSVPYDETDAVEPQGVYGHSKLAGERAVAAANPAHVILRTAWVYSPFGANFVKTMLRVGKERDVLRVVADQHGTPTYAPDIAAGIAAVLARVAAEPEGADWRGIFHMVAAGETSWAGFAEAIFAESARRGGPSARVEPITTADYPTPARRPANSRLATAKFQRTFDHTLPAWRDGLSRCMDALLAE
ncbi:dTDP-4-dehydrorhamnose reductase [Consotaella salsifontis]|uniref:dTDP-4-dehydrorhamnose reductase n=1 Tax=Consotaella salsifontis TaxID=1365950 RepID=A0A1T4P263_9HYPH|nr:dTDP-4-dehydrorhamnose reductase [Consotaella salsifontis]SJZ85573.1 dTDP-4-dehydrorhamnose reductase [Consotaella salsifontis]